jgi:uncharacterized OB-fold protein
MPEPMKGYECQECQHRCLFASLYCRNCGTHRSYTPTEITGKGKIFSYTIVHFAEERFQSEVPYALIIVDMNHQMRVLGRLNRLDLDTLSIGTTVQYIGHKNGIPAFK